MQKVTDRAKAKDNKLFQILRNVVCSLSFAVVAGYSTFHLLSSFIQPTVSAATDTV